MPIATGSPGSATLTRKSSPGIRQASNRSTRTSFPPSPKAGKTVEAVDSIAQGRVWAGRDAIGIGLVDEFGTLSDAIAYAAKEAGLGKNYGLATYPEHKSVTLKDLLSSKPEKEPLVAVETPAELRPVLRLLEDRKAVPVTYALPEAVIEIR